MKKIPISIGTSFLLILMYLSIHGCSPIYYSPNSHNVPLLKKKGDVRLGLHGNATRLEASTAFAVEDHVGLTLDGGVFSPQMMNRAMEGKGSLYRQVAGISPQLGKTGYLKPLGCLAMARCKIIFRRHSTAFPATTGVLDANLIRFGVQPAFGFSSRFFDAAISARICGLSYFNTGGSLVFDREDQVAYLDNQGTQFLIEPAITLRGGLEYLKLQVQLGRSINVTNSDFRQDDGHITVGLLYTLDR